MILGVVLVMHVNAEFTVEGVGGIAQWLIGFGSDGRAGCCVHQNPWSGDNFRLIGVKNWDVIEGAVQRASLLPSHEGDVRGGSALQTKLSTHACDAEQD